MSFNYYDEMRSSGMFKWASELNKSYINSVAPSVKIFKIDKEKTIIDELYGEAQNRIYLPPFEMRAMMLDNPWAQILGKETMPYLETEENMKFVVNFEDMIVKIRDLKVRHISDITITFTGSGVGTIEKTGNALMLKKNNILVQEFDLTASDNSTTKKLSANINSLSEFSAKFSGNNDSSEEIVDFASMKFMGKSINIYSPDKTFATMTDIIEKGDVILTNKMKLYEVLSNMPGGDFGWDYTTFVLDCNTRTLDKADLPSDYVRQIAGGEYGFRNKVDAE